MKQLGIIGKPLTHSFSPNYFSEKFKQLGIKNHQYDKFELDQIADLPNILSNELIGLNVTIPYKEAVIPYLDALNEEAQAIGAVNVIKIEQKEGKPFLTGYNSDMFGFMNSFKPHLKSSQTKALVFGTGGASKAVVFALEKMGISFQYVSRKKTETALCYEEIDEKLLREYTILINCTPMGTFPEVDNCLPIPYNFLTEEHYCYDLVYNPEQTKFMRLSERQGAFTINGYDMLIAQAEKAWEIWKE